jgi:hypothetical protein
MKNTKRKFVGEETWCQYCKCEKTLNFLKEENTNTNVNEVTTTSQSFLANAGSPISLNDGEDLKTPSHALLGKSRHHTSPSLL